MSTTLTSAFDPAFQARLRSWLEESGELLVLFRYTHAAGSKDFELFNSFTDLKRRIEGLPPVTSVIAFKERQLPLRGLVDADFIAECLRTIPDDAEYLILHTQPVSYGSHSWYHFDADTGHARLASDLAEARGLAVASGRHPPWLVDSDVVISATTPGEDGALHSGIY